MAANDPFPIYEYIFMSHFIKFGKSSGYDFIFSLTHEVACVYSHLPECTIYIYIHLAIHTCPSAQYIYMFAEIWFITSKKMDFVLRDTGWSYFSWISEKYIP